VYCYVFCFVNFDRVGIKNGGTVRVADGADGEERAGGEFWHDVGNSGLEWELWDR
jgi:hypothetical protein